MGGGEEDTIVTTCDKAAEFTLKKFSTRLQENSLSRHLVTVAPPFLR